MIKSFKNKQLKRFFLSGDHKGIHSSHRKKLERMLDLLDSIQEISDMNYPGSALHKLNPKNENRWAVKVSGNWRLVFVFENGDVFEVDYTDYH